MSDYKREKNALPDMESDGIFVKPLAIQGYLHSEKSWHAGLDPWQRMNSHHTYSSVRRHVHFKPFRIMKDHLDFILSTTYQHNRELFPESCDVVFQPITLGLVPKKKEILTAREVYAKSQQKNIGGLQAQREYVLSQRLCPEHPLVIGGIKEKIHPSSVKLMNSSHHSPQTNAGYVRQDRDGNLFQY